MSIFSAIVLLGLGLDGRPAGLLGQVEHVLHGVELDHVEIGMFALVDQFLPPLLEFVADELQKDQAQHHMLVFRGFHRPAQFVGGVPQGLLKGFVVGLVFGRCFSCHTCSHPFYFAAPGPSVLI